MYHYMSNKRAGMTIILLSIFCLILQIPKFFITPSAWEMFWIALSCLNLFMGFRIMRRPCAVECEDEYDDEDECEQ